MKQKYYLLSGALCLSVFTLSGCDTFRNTFGLDHYQADAFAVPENPPLSIPPDYKLRPPRPGAAQPNVESASNKAQKAVLGKVKNSTTVKSSDMAEKNLLAKAGNSTEVTSDIRAKVNEEAKAEADLAGKLAALKDKAVKNLTSLTTEEVENKKEQRVAQSESSKSES